MDISQIIKQKTVGNLLNLSDLFLGNSCCEAVAKHILSNRSITSLNLKGNNISYEGISSLFPALSNSSLKILNLQWNNLGSEGSTELLAESVKNSLIQELDLRNNRITDSGAVALAEALLHMSQLKILDLRWNQVTEKGVVALIQSSEHSFSLSKLELAGNPIQTESIETNELSKFNLANDRSQSRNSSVASPLSDRPSSAYMGTLSLKGSREGLSLETIVFEYQKERELQELELEQLREGILGAENEYQMVKNLMEARLREEEKENLILREKLRELEMRENGEEIKFELTKAINSKIKEAGKLEVERDLLRENLKEAERKLSGEETVLNTEESRIEKQFLEEKNLNLRKRILDLERDLEVLVSDYTEQLVELDKVLQERDEQIARLKVNNNRKR